MYICFPKTKVVEMLTHVLWFYMKDRGTQSTICFCFNHSPQAGNFSISKNKHHWKSSNMCLTILKNAVGRIWFGTPGMGEGTNYVYKRNFNFIEMVHTNLFSSSKSAIDLNYNYQKLNLKVQRTTFNISNLFRNPQTNIAKHIQQYTFKYVHI